MLAEVGIGHQQRVEVIVRPRNVDRKTYGDRGRDGLLGARRVQQTCRHGGHQFVDVQQRDVPAGTQHQIKVVILGQPHVRAGGVPADIEVEVLIELVTRVEVEHRGPQVQRRQQPGLQVVELRPAGRRACHIEPPRVHGELLDTADDALRVGVGAGRQIEGLALRRVHDHRRRRRSRTRGPLPAGRVTRRRTAPRMTAIQHPVHSRSAAWNQSHCCLDRPPSVEQVAPRRSAISAGPGHTRRTAQITPATSRISPSRRSRIRTGSGTASR